MTRAQRRALGLGAILLSLAFSGCTGAKMVAEEETAATDLFPVLSVEQAGEDQLPESFTEFTGFALEDTRKIGDSEYGQHFIAAGLNNDLCLIMISAAQDEFNDTQQGAVTCPEIKEVRANGIKLELPNFEPSAVSFLLPPDVTLKAVNSTIAGALSEQSEAEVLSVKTLTKDSAIVLVTTQETMSILGKIQIPRPSGAPLVLRPF